MTHERECPLTIPAYAAKSHLCICIALRSAHARGYREGFNAHAMAAEHWKATHGAYPQHGTGERP